MPSNLNLETEENLSILHYNTVATEKISNTISSKFLFLLVLHNIILVKDESLLGGLPRPLGPGKVEGIGLGLRSPLFGILHPEIPTILFDKSDRVFLRGERHHHVGQGIPAGRPAHEVVLPPLLGVELDPPPADPGRSGLHSVLGRTEDPDVALLDVLLGDPGDCGQIHGALHGDRALHLPVVG